MRVIRDSVPKRTIVVRTGGKPWLDDRYVLAHRATCGVVVGGRLIERSTGRLVVMLSLCIKILNEQSLNETNHS